MKNTLNWIKTHKFLTAVITMIVFAFPLLAVHCLFKWYSGIPWFEAEWGAGDVLGYIAGFEALLGTVVLGVVTIYQAQKAEETNKRLAKENNYLQKVSIQQMLPLVKISELTINNTIETSNLRNETSATVMVGTLETRDKREIHLYTCLPLQGLEERYHKRVDIVFENISGSPISCIAVDKIEFPGFKYKENFVDGSSCCGVEYAKYINWLTLPGDKISVIVDIYFDNRLFRDFWEFFEMTSIGCFDMCLYLTNRSLSGIEYKEKIYIKRHVGFKEQVMYKAYEEEVENA